MGLSALLVSDEQGNAKALTSGTSDRTGSTFLIFVYQLSYNFSYSPKGPREILLKYEM